LHDRGTGIESLRRKSIEQLVAEGGDEAHGLKRTLGALDLAALGPLVPLLGIGMCLFLMAGLPRLTWERFFLWLLVGLVVCFSYGRRHSRLAARRGEATQLRET